MASLLTITSNAMLVEKEDKTIRLLFEDHWYGPNELVPYHILEKFTGHADRLTAAAFVCQCEQERYGPMEEGWPPLVRDFLSLG